MWHFQCETNKPDAIIAIPHENKVQIKMCGVPTSCMCKQLCI